MVQLRDNRPRLEKKKKRDGAFERKRRHLKKYQEGKLLELNDSYDAELKGRKANDSNFLLWVTVQTVVVSKKIKNKEEGQVSGKVIHSVWMLLEVPMGYSGQIFSCLNLGDKI